MSGEKDDDGRTAIRLGRHRTIIHQARALFKHVMRELSHGVSAAAPIIIVLFCSRDAGIAFQGHE